MPATPRHQGTFPPSQLPSSPAKLEWLALYTKSRQEKIVMKRLLEDGMEAFVPLQKVVKQWSDRRKLVEEPLIRSYCFVHVTPDQQHKVLNTPGAVRFVWFSGRPAAIPAKQIDLLKILTGFNIPVECIPGHIQPGTKVKITAGPMAGFTGELVTVLGKSRVIVRLTELETNLSVTVSPMLLERVMK
jgi:transcriptional antiterminator RfaH